MYFKLIFPLILFSISCTSISKKNNQGGVVVSEFKSFNGDSIAINSVIKIWYQSDFVIEEIGSTSIKTDSTGISSTSYTPQKYLFIDLKRKKFSEYDSFDINAKRIKAYTQNDSTFIEGGWNFYWNKNVEIQGELINLDDTLENGKTYQRIFFHQKGFDSTKYYCIGYLDCKRTPMFSYVKSLPESYKCPVTRLIMFDKMKNIKLMELSLVQKSTSLTDSEASIFLKWKNDN